MELAVGAEIATANEFVNGLFGSSDIDERPPSSSLSQLAISSSDLLESVNTTTTTATTATNAQNTKKESASSDETIVIIDEKSLHRFLPFSFILTILTC